MDRKWVGLMVAALVATAGCGGAQGLSRVELARRANAICARRGAGLRSAFAGQKDFHAVMEQALPVLDKAARELSALKPSANEQDAYAKFVAIETEQVRRLRGNLTRTRPARRTAEGHGRRNVGPLLSQLATQLGLTVCVGAGKVPIVA